MIELNKGQKQAMVEILDWLQGRSPAISLSGPAGTGKSFMTRELLPTLSHGRTVLLTATTGKAALRLRELTGEETKTLHSTLYQPPDDEAGRAKNGKLVFDQMRDAPEGAVLVIDEASMVTPDVWKDVNAWINDYGVRVILIGDGFQLPPVVDANKEEDFNVFSLVKGPRLYQVMRNGDDILDAATALRTEGKMLRENRGAYGWRRAKLAHVLKEWLENQDGHAIITWRNKVRMTANRVVRQAMNLDSQFPLPGEPILVRRNGRGFLNGQIVTMVEPSKAGPALGPIQTSWLKVQAEDASPRLMFASCQGANEIMDGQIPYLEDDAWKEYIKAKRRFEYAWAKEHNYDLINKAPPRMDPTPVTWGYCLTCHAGQGSEWDRVTVYLDAWDTSSNHFLKPSILADGTKVPFWTRWVYTAITRAKKRVDVVIGE